MKRKHNWDRYDVTTHQNESKRKSKFYGGYEQSSASSFYFVSFYFNDEI